MGAGPRTQGEVIQAAAETAARILRGLEEENIDGIYNAYKVAQDDILAQVQRQIMAEGWDLSTMQRTGRLQSMLANVTDILDGLKKKLLGQKMDGMDGLISDGALGQFNGAYQYSVYAMDQATPDSVTAMYNLPPSDTVRALNATEYKGAMYSQRIGMITDEMAADIRDELMQSMIQGETMDQAAARVAGVIGADSEAPGGIYSRAETIARTEMMRASNQALDLSYSQNSDIVEATEWVVAPDDRMCPWCGRREGLTDDEIDQADSGDDPFENSTECPLHPRCRCTKAPVLKSWSDLIGLDMPENMPDDVRGMRDDNGDWTIAPVDSFNTWLEDRQLAQAMTPE